MPPSHCKFKFHLLHLMASFSHSMGDPEQTPARSLHHIEVSKHSHQVTLPSLLWDLHDKLKAGRRMYQALLSLQTFRAFLGGQVMVLPALYPRELSGGCLSTKATISLVGSAANLMGRQLWLKNTLVKKKSSARPPRLWQHQGVSIMHPGHKSHQTNQCLAGQIQASQ